MGKSLKRKSSKETQGRGGSLRQKEEGKDPGSREQKVTADAEEESKASFVICFPQAVPSPVNMAEKSGQTKPCHPSAGLQSTEDRAAPWFRAQALSLASSPISAEAQGSP